MFLRLSFNFHAVVGVREAFGVSPLIFRQGEPTVFTDVEKVEIHSVRFSERPQWELLLTERAARDVHMNTLLSKSLAE